MGRFKRKLDVIAKESGRILKTVIFEELLEVKKKKKKDYVFKVTLLWH